MKVVPRAFYEHPEIEKILVDGHCCVIKKQVSEIQQENQRYLSVHALTLVLNGALQIETYDGNFQKVDKNQFVFLPKGMYMISDIIPKNSSFEALVFFFDEQLINTFLKAYDTDTSEKRCGTMLIGLNGDLRLFVDTLLSLYQGKNRHRFTQSKLLEFLHLIATTPEGKDFVKRLKSIKKRDRKSVQEFMEEHYDKPLDVDDYAYLTGRSVSTFQRDFKRRFKISPKKWLIEKRLEKAAYLLQNSRASVSDVTTSVGYENISHFIKAFHKKYGTSPKQFQIAHRKNILI